MESTLTEFWSRCEGQVVNSYRLERHLSGTVYSTEYGADSRPAAIKLLPGDGSEWQRQLTTWATISQLSHPALIRLFDWGQGEIDGIPLLYVVMERPEGSLAGVLPERPLTETETREMLAAALDALAHLHENGLVHGGLEPANIMAVGEEIKLASDCITRSGEIGARSTSDVCPAPESWDGVVTPASDVWSLGATVVQALTQRPPELASGDGSDAVIPKNLPEPFYDIALHCLRRTPRSRWTVAQIAARLRSPKLVTIPRTAAPKNPRSWVALYAMVGAMLVVAAILLLPGREGSQTGIGGIPETVTQRVEAAPPAPRQAPPENAVPKPGKWFVVVATYAQKEAAEKRAESMTLQWPQFKAEAYSPPLKQKPYYHLVVIGSNLSQDAAAALKEQAQSTGFSRDAYITQF